MDAHGLLASQGWRGSGHSLHPTSDKTGLTKPLLVSRKQNNYGVGKKQHKTSDMWWMDAFDKSLKGLDMAQKGKVVQTVTSGGLDMVVKGGSRFVGNRGLYASFVKGESLSGTIATKDAEEPTATKRQGQEEKCGETKEERRARKAIKRAARARSLLNVDPSTPILIGKSGQVSEEKETIAAGEVETKEQRQEFRKQKKLMRQARRDSMEDSIKPVKRKKRQKG